MDAPNPGTFVVSGPATATRLARARSVTLDVMVMRESPFDGDIVVQLEGLPSGVTATIGGVPATSGAVVVTLAATDAVPLGTASFTIRATGEGISATAMASLEIVGTPGTVDAAFGTAGSVVVALPSSIGLRGFGVAPNGSIFGGSTTNGDRVAVWHVTPEGQLDAAFAPSATVTGILELDIGVTPSVGLALGATSDNGVIVSGRYTTTGAAGMYILKRNGDGTPATGYASNGLGVYADVLGGNPAGSVRGGLIMPNDAFYAVGTCSNFAAGIAAFTPTGTVDTSQWGGGFCDAPPATGAETAQSVAKLPDGRFVIGTVLLPSGGTSSTRLTMLNAGGVDTTWGNSGHITTGLTPAISFFPFTFATSTNAVVAGYTNGSNGATRRYTSTGLDNSFGIDGAAPGSFGTAFGADGDATLVAGAISNQRIAIQRVRADGTLDPDFGVNGVSIVPRPADILFVTHIARQPTTGKIVLGLSGDDKVGVLRVW